MGHGDINDRTSPTKISLLDGRDINEIACGGFSSFAWNRNSIFSWGLNSKGELGFGDFKGSNVPQRRSLRVKFLICGENHCFCLSYDNDIWSWGDNEMGQLGLEIKKSKISNPQKVLFFQNHREVYSIACGGAHSLFWTSQGLFACGLNHSGQLGLGAKEQGSTFESIQEVSFFKEKQILSIGAGNCHSFCMTTEGLYGWGGNMYGQLSFSETIIPSPRNVSFLDPKSKNVTMGKIGEPFTIRRILLFILCRELIDDETINLFHKDYLCNDLFNILLRY